MKYFIAAAVGTLVALIFGYAMRLVAQYNFNAGFDLASKLCDVPEARRIVKEATA